jgi:flavin-dependent thymidylate synthase
MREIEKKLYDERSKAGSLDGSMFDIGYDNIEVKLLDWPKNPYDLIWQETMTSWTTNIPIEDTCPYEKIEVKDVRTGEVSLDTIKSCKKRLVLDVLEGRMLPNALESLQFTFVVSGVTRITTHQIVRARIGVVFNQFSTRFANVSQVKFRVPPELKGYELERFQSSCKLAKEVYKELIESGIHEQLARYVLPDSIETTICESWNYLALRAYTRQRACSIAQPEHRVVAEKMINEVKKVYPLLAKYMWPACWSGNCLITPDNIRNLQIPYNETARNLECDCPGWAKVRDKVLEAGKVKND